AHAGLDVMERLSGPQAPQGIGGGLGIDEKLGDVATHILFALIAQPVELGLVGVENRAVRRSPLKGDGRVLEAILALHLLHPPLQGDGRPAQYILPPLLQSARERGSHGVAGPRAPPRCEKVAPADTRSIASWLCSTSGWKNCVSSVLLSPRAAGV